MGIVPAGSVAYTCNLYDGTGTWDGIGTLPVTGPTPDCNGSLGPGNSNCGLKFFDFRSALAIPRIQTGYSIVSAPDIGEEFSLSRSYGGLLEMWSSTITSGATALNGVVSCCVISDTTDIAQNENGTDCFAVVDMAESARTKQEIIKENSIADGVISVQGSDISTVYRPPDSYDVDTVYGGWEDLSANIPSLIVREAVDAAGVVFYNLISFWCSPWNVACYENDGGGTTAPLPSVTVGIGAGGPVPVSKLPEMGFLDFRVKGSLYISNPSVEPVEGSRVINVMAVSFFASIDDTTKGSVVIKQVVSRRTFTVSNAGALVSAAIDAHGLQEVGGGNYSFDYELSIASEVKTAGGMAALGKYIGTRVTVSDGLGTAFGSDIQLNLTQLKIYARSREQYSEGKLGPVHIIRYDQVGEGQNIRFTGVINTESVAKANIAPYVRDAIMNSRISGDVNMYPLVYHLYNGYSPFKCSWDRADWKNFVDTFIVDLDPDKLKMLADKDDRIKAAAEAGGIFGDIGKALGAVGGALIGDPELGSALGGMAGHAVDSAVGASGQFGIPNRSMSNAGAQFGLSSAGAQFGIRPRSGTY